MTKTKTDKNTKKETDKNGNNEYILTSPQSDVGEVNWSLWSVASPLLIWNIYCTYLVESSSGALLGYIQTISGPYFFCLKTFKHLMFDSALMKCPLGFIFLLINTHYWLFVSVTSLKFLCWNVWGWLERQFQLLPFSRSKFSSLELRSEKKL